MKHVNVTPRDIVNSMSEDTKHSFAIYCLVNHTNPEEVLENISRVITNSINIGIDLCNDFFKTSAGKEYLEIRRKIEITGGNTK